MKSLCAFRLVLGSSILAAVSSFVVPTPSDSIAAAAATRRPTTMDRRRPIPSSRSSLSAVDAPSMPSHSPATSLRNRIYSWRGYDVRYQVSGPEDADHTLLLIHGLFVNSDHWRRALTGLGGGSGGTDGSSCRIYALDLLGCGWSSKPSRDDPAARAIDGENGRFLGCDSVRRGGGAPGGRRSAPVLGGVPLGTAAGGNRVAPSLDLRHPLRSPYNFYTWAEQIADFTNDVVLGGGDNDKKVTLVANSIGTISALQSIIDQPNLFNGCFVINPNFRELHAAEVPFAPLFMPLIRRVQSLLRTKGHGLFEALATPGTVTEILKEPYAVVEAIDEELVSVLLDPLLTEGADDVVFDTLSYSAGPLPEQQLSSPEFPGDCPVWVVYGKDDPWTPARRVENLRKVCGRPGEEYGSSPVERVVGLEGAGHCPHDECPEKVNGLILEFLDRLTAPAS